MLDHIGKGDTLVIPRSDRLTRSLSHLLKVIERRDTRGEHLRSLEAKIAGARDPAGAVRR